MATLRTEHDLTSMISGRQRRSFPVSSAKFTFLEINFGIVIVSMTVMDGIKHNRLRPSSYAYYKRGTYVVFIRE